MRVFEVMHIPAAAQIINFVVLTAALSSMNCNLYMATRMIFSLSRAGYAPESLGRITPKGTPFAALLFSAGGLAAAVLLAYLFPGSAYVYMLGISLFGGLFAWLLIFITHYRFRRHWDARTDRTLPVRAKYLSVHHDSRRHGRTGRPDLDVVGRWHARDPASGSSVAGVADDCVLCRRTPTRDWLRKRRSPPGKPQPPRAASDFSCATSA